MAITVDAHQHFWDRSIDSFDNAWQEEPGNEPICRSFLPDDLEQSLQDCGIDQTVFVQTQHDTAENRWALNLAEQFPWIAGVVGWVDLASAECESQIEEFADDGKFVGVRHVVQDEPDDDFIVRKDVMRGLRLLEKHELTYDLLFFPRHLKHVPRLATEHDHLRLVINHLAKPEIKAGKIDDWKNDLLAASGFPNVFCKLSGLATEADHANWSADDLRPYVETALEAFSPGRCMFGSDWPVCNLAGSYRDIFDAMMDCIGGVSESERQMILGGTATGFYGLDRTGSNRSGPAKNV